MDQIFTTLRHELTIANIAVAVCFYFIIHTIVFLVKKLANRTERLVAITTHHSQRGKYDRHVVRRPLECMDGKCQLL